MSNSWNNATSGGTESEFTQGPGGGANTGDLNQEQGRGGAYDELQGSQPGGMGGGQGAMGSGVAGGYSGNQQQTQQSQQTQTGEKQDWLDKGIEAIGKKAGFSISNKNADTAGDWVNKEVDERAGRNLPGVH
ncbi:hypothetical protein BC628DRAFT_1418762 [Trametes gibbosa]|nr:hypothetical protein BC628DRAFT_1418762 [Trametes gibbosa]